MFSFHIFISAFGNASTSVLSGASFFDHPRFVDVFCLLQKFDDMCKFNIGIPYLFDPESYIQSARGIWGRTPHKSLGIAEWLFRLSVR